MTDSFKDNGRICALAFTGLANNFDGSFSPCCFSNNISEEIDNQKELTDVLNSNGFIELRKSMLEGKFHPQCISCYDLEKSGGQSLRNECNERFEHLLGETISDLNDDYTIKSPQIRYFSLRASNVCNFKCRTCNSICSTSIGVEQGEFLKINPIESKLGQVIESLNYVENLYFAGGEPFLQKEFYEVADYILKNSTAVKTISINTNFSIDKFKDHFVVELLKSFIQKKIKIKLFVSVDGVGEKGELIRSGFQWGTFVKNLKIFKDAAPELEFNFVITVSMLNIHLIPETIERVFVVTGIIGFQPDMISLNYVFDPEFLCVLNLNDNEKSYLEDVYLRYINKWKGGKLNLLINKLENVLAYLKEKPLENIELNRKKFIDQNNVLNEKRNETSTILFKYNIEKDFIEYQ